MLSAHIGWKLGLRVARLLKEPLVKRLAEQVFFIANDLIRLLDQIVQLVSSVVAVKRLDKQAYLIHARPAHRRIAMNHPFNYPRKRSGIRSPPRLSHLLRKFLAVPKEPPFLAFWIVIIGSWRKWNSSCEHAPRNHSKRKLMRFIRFCPVKFLALQVLAEHRLHALPKPAIPKPEFRSHERSGMVVPNCSFL